MGDGDHDELENAIEGDGPRHGVWNHRRECRKNEESLIIAVVLFYLYIRVLV